VQNLQVGKDLRDHRHRCHRDADCKNDHQRAAIAIRPRKRRTNHPWREAQPHQEGKARAHNCQPAYLAPLFPREQLLRLRAGKKHQQQQPEPVHKVKNISLVLRPIHDVRNGGHTAKEGGSENNSRQDLAHHLRLP
jgi:hypothetical protein